VSLPERNFSTQDVKQEVGNSATLHET